MYDFTLLYTYYYMRDVNCLCDIRFKYFYTLVVLKNNMNFILVYYIYRKYSFRSKDRIYVSMIYNVTVLTRLLYIYYNFIR